MPSTLLPFLYHTRTILRLTPRMHIRTPTQTPIPTPVVLARSLHATCIRPRGAKADIPFATDVPGEDVPMETPRGTITPSERQVFERIFADIRARGLKPQHRDDEPPAVQSSQSSRSAMLIMQQAAQDARQARPATVTAPGLLAGAAKDRNKALLRFPPELRAAASKALDQVSSQAMGTRKTGIDSSDDDKNIEFAGEEKAVADDWKAPPHSFGRTIELEAKRHPERLRVETAIINASTDIELWNVLEKEVFTMPARLGLGAAVEKEDDEVELAAEAEAEAGAGAEAEEDIGAVVEDGSEDTSDAVEPGATAEPPQKLSLYVHGPLYPAYLLLALRRLNQAYSAPSPLIYTLLPRIKQLGLKSYVLGVSTPFYNELLRIYWQRRGDLNGILGILEEMRHCGLYFDEQTASIIDQIDEAIYSMAGNESPSQFGRYLMNMPEYEAPGEYILNTLLLLSPFSCQTFSSPHPKYSHTGHFPCFMFNLPPPSFPSI
ncbi:hypothetical protein F4810DRAFT_687542 [Camillea tinctor]|nr:hypothetical protein F4810DRAFT_687542 [Camillea tinctor]